MTTSSVQEILPAALDSTSELPSFLDGITRMYVNYQCPYSQRLWMTRNYKGLQENIKLVAIDLQNRPSWYKEKIYPENKVPALEHDGKIMGESLDLMKYLDAHFEGPAVFPNDSEKQKYSEELLSYSATFIKLVFAAFKGEPLKEADAPFDYIENALQKFEDGPFFLGEFSAVDIAYAPFIERFQIFLQEMWNYDIISGRPKLAAWIEAMNQIEAYKQTKCDPKKLVESYKIRFQLA